MRNGGRQRESVNGTSSQFYFEEQSISFPLNIRQQSVPLGNTSYTTGKLDYFPFKWSHICKQWMSTRAGYVGCIHVRFTTAKQLFFTIDFCLVLFGGLDD